MVRLALPLALFLALTVRTASAQSRPIYLQFDPYTVKGALYRPDSGDQPTIGVLLIHRVNNYLGHLAASELARRGFLVLAMNSRFDNNEAAVLWEQIALDVKTGVEFLKRQGGVRTVVLFGHSGGAATLSFYQAVVPCSCARCPIRPRTAWSCCASSTPSSRNATRQHRYWPEGNAVGKRTSRGEVIGVVSDSQEKGLTTAPRPAIYLSLLRAMRQN